ncbi:MAG: hypothetical protein ACYTG1_11575 [Planctomycetota bacterium]|jgi:Rod binding domain-containing protein
MIPPASLPPALVDGRAALPAPGAAGVATTFAAHLDAARGDGSAPRAAAAAFVANAFVQPVLASLRESTLATGPFAPGSTEKRFGPLLDRHLADRIASAPEFPLVDAILARLAPTAPEGDPTA